MVDKIRPLKLESSSSGGTENDLFPSELQPLEDYVSCKGIAFEGSDNARLELIGSEVSFVDPVSGSKKLKTLKIEEFTFFSAPNPFISSQSSSFVVVSRFIWRGTNQLTAPTTVRAVVSVSESSVEGEVRLYDLTNSTILGTSQAFTSTDPVIEVLSTSGWSAGPAVIEVQLRRSAGSGTRNARISSLSLEW